jgi:hypothetical protein
VKLIQQKEEFLMLKIIAAMVASCAVLAGLALAIDEQSVAGQVTDTPTETPAAPTDTPSPAPSVTASPTAAPTSTAAVGTASPTRTAGPATVTPAAVPGTGGEPGGSSNLLLILTLGAGVVAGTAGLAGIAVSRRS